MTPRGLPPEIRARLHAEPVAALTAPDVRERFATRGLRRRRRHARAVHRVPARADRALDEGRQAEGPDAGMRPD
jgi:tripartite-type tricarboxylate transporter receptor subunit TctC